MATVDINNLPKPECKGGYTKSQLEDILGSNLETFNKYMIGKQWMLCNGKEYDKVPNGCGPHGVVAYKLDLMRFLEGLPPFD